MEDFISIYFGDGEKPMIMVLSPSSSNTVKPVCLFLLQLCFLFLFIGCNIFLVPC